MFWIMMWLLVVCDVLLDADVVEVVYSAIWVEIR